MSDAPFAINPQLSAVAIGYKNPDVSLIADQIMPRVPTAESFKWTKYANEQAYTVPDTRVGRRSEPNTVTFGGTEQTDSVVDFGLDDPIPQRDIDTFAAMPKPASGGPIEPRMLATIMLTNLVRLAREIRVAALVQNGANYAAGLQTTLSGGSQWSDYANSDPLNDLLQAIDAPLIRPNTLTLSQPVWTVLRQHPKLVQAIRNTNQGAGVIQRQELADRLEIKQVLIGESRVNTARKGQTASFARVWGPHASLTYSSQLAADTFQPLWGWTAQFGAIFAGEIAEPKKGLKGSTTVRVGEQVKEVVAAPDAGYLLKNVI